MSEITKTVNKTTVTGSEIFIYTISASYYGLSNQNQQGKIIDFFPSKIIYILPATSNEIKSIKQTIINGGTRVEFDLGEVSTGTSLSFEIACSFGPGRVDNDSYSNNVQLLADNTVVAEATSETVNLILRDNFKLKKYCSPYNTVDLGQEITYTLTLDNYDGDAGTKISNIVITDTLPPELTPLTSYTPIGKDQKIDGYSNPSVTGLTGTWNDKTMTFTIPEYTGISYEISFKAKVTDNLEPGTTIKNVGNLKINNQSRNDAAWTVTVFDPSALGIQLSKYGNKTAIPGGPISYFLSCHSTAPNDFANYYIEDTLPDGINLQGLRLHSDNSLKNYSIFIALASNPAKYIPIVENVASGHYPYTSLSKWVPAGDSVKKIKLTADTLNAEFSYHILFFDGVVDSSLTD